MYRDITHGIQIDVEPEFVPEESHPNEKYFFFSYKVKITNTSDSPKQLVSRHWIITDGHGETKEVEGPGVIGEQPELAPGQSFDYASFCPLPTPTGNMRGKYWMVDKESGEKFAVRIPLFFLRDVNSLH